MSQVHIHDFIPKGWEQVAADGAGVLTSRSDALLSDDSKRSYARAQCADHLRYIIGAAVTDGSFRAVDRLDLIHRLSSAAWLDSPAQALNALDVALASARTAIDAHVRSGVPIEQVTPRAGDYPLYVRAYDVFLKYHAALVRMKLVDLPEPSLFATRAD